MKCSVTVLQRQTWVSWCITSIQRCYKKTPTVDKQEYSLQDKGNNPTLYGTEDSSTAILCSVLGAHRSHQLASAQRRKKEL